MLYLDPHGDPVKGSLLTGVGGDALERLRARAHAMGLEIDGRVKHDKVAGAHQFDPSRTVGHILEVTPGSPW